MRGVRAALLLGAALVALAGCNTVNGMGRDLSSAGTAVSTTAKKVGQGL
jgi:predicted small secreted protein